MADVQYARSGECFIAYRIRGAGPFDLLSVGGLVTNLEVAQEWPPNVHLSRRLASFSRSIEFDKRGVGLSDRVPHIAPEDVLDDIRAVMDAVGSQRVALWGTADGGALAALFAATYPERTSALVLYGSYARRRWAADYPWGISDVLHERIQAEYVNRWGRDQIGLASAAPHLVADPDFRAYWLRVQRLGASPGGALAWYRMTAEIDVREILPTIQAPTLVIHRVGDRAFDIANGRYLAEHIPGAALIELTGDQHVFVDEDLDDVVEPIEQFLTGNRSAVDPDRVLATILFTDIVGSTERAVALGDRRWHQLLETHDETTRRIIEQHRGRVIKTTGDGVLALFDGPARAVRSARATIAAAAHLGIEIRAGLHTGECDLRGGEVAGVAVHLASRICDAAGSRELLVSQTVKDLVVGSELTFAGLGPHELKGVPGTWELWSSTGP